MDERCTLPVNGTFIDTIKELEANGSRADLLLDINNGLERASGTIKKFDQVSGGSTILLDTGQLINVEEIIAINGLFKSDYTCC